MFALRLIEEDGVRVLGARSTTVGAGAGADELATSAAAAGAFLDPVGGIYLGRVRSSSRSLS